MHKILYVSYSITRGEMRQCNSSIKEESIQKELAIHPLVLLDTQ